MIHIEQLTKRFRTLTAVDRLSLDIDQGEVFGFLGPNGAGKTTTVRMLTCLIAPTDGKASVAGYKVGEESQSVRRNVGILTETPGFYDTLNAERNLTIYAELYEVENPAKQVEKYLGMLGLWERRHDEVGSFSKGMRQKLAIARALIHEPKVVFLDEPTSGLDPEASRLIRDFIVELRNERRTIFLCTHNLDEADRLCDRVGLFKSRLLAVDTPANLRNKLFGRRVVFHLQAPKDGLADGMKQRFAFVQNVQAVDNKIVVTLDDPEGENPQLINWLVSEGAQLQFVGELRRSLEDVYLQLISSAK